jgi:hypothetical protein
LVSFGGLIKMDPRLPPEIIDSALQGIFEAGIGIINVSEFLGSFGVSFVFVGMPLAGKALERNVDLTLGAVVFKSENVVEIAPASWTDEAEPTGHYE